MSTIDMSAASAPPKKRSPSTRSARTASAVETNNPSDVQRRSEGLQGLAAMAQGICVLTGMHADAAAIGMFFPPVADELAKVAEANESIAKPIDLLINVGPYGALIGAVMPFAFQIAANHGWIDASRLAGQGVVPPAVLEARMKAQVLQMAAEAQRTQNEALAKARQAEEAYNAAMAEAV